MSDKVLFSKRHFINKLGHHSSAAIICDIKDCRADEYGDPFQGHFHISDCEKKISLAMDFGSAKDLDNTLFKLDRIIAITKAYRDEAAKLRPDIKKYVKEQKAKEQKDKGKAKAIS